MKGKHKKPVKGKKPSKRVEKKVFNLKTYHDYYPPFGDNVGMSVQHGTGGIPYFNSLQASMGSSFGLTNKPEYVLSSYIQPQRSVDDIIETIVSKLNQTSKGLEKKEMNTQTISTTTKPNFLNQTVVTPASNFSNQNNTATTFVELVPENKREVVNYIKPVEMVQTKKDTTKQNQETAERFKADKKQQMIKHLRGKLRGGNEL
jgi:hypothetical protein